MVKKALYLQAYKLMERVTPLKKDCGNLCNKACCQGVDQESGMYLYPGEEELQYEYKTDSLTIKSVNFPEHPILLAICNGECKRDQRPLACRIFPSQPIIHQKIF